jgi:hypothetical protein
MQYVISRLCVPTAEAVYSKYVNTIHKIITQHESVVLCFNIVVLVSRNWRGAGGEISVREIDTQPKILTGYTSGRVTATAIKHRSYHGRISAFMLGGYMISIVRTSGGNTN